MRYVIAIILPPVAVLLYGNGVQFLVSLILTLLFWIPGMIHAVLIVKNYIEEKQEEAISRNILTSQTIRKAIK